MQTKYFQSVGSESIFAQGITKTVTKFWLKGKVPSLTIGLGFTCGQRDPELCDRASLTLPLLVIVSDGPLDDELLCACADRAWLIAGAAGGLAPLLHLLWPARCSPGAARPSGDICSRGLLAGAKVVNKSVQSAMLVVVLFQIFAPNCLFCVTCRFLVRLQSLCRLSATRHTVLAIELWKLA